MDGKMDHLWKHIIGTCQKVDFKSRAKILDMNSKEGTTAAMETMPLETVNSPLMASGISTTASASMSSCTLKERGMNQMTNYKRSYLKSLKAFYEPARLSDLKQCQMILALLHAMIAGGVPFNFVKTYHFQE